MTEITPEAVKAALGAATPGPWLEHWDSEGSAFVSGSRCVRAAMTGPDKHKENARLISMTPDLAAAYLAAMEEIERLRKRVEAADALADADAALDKAVSEVSRLGAQTGPQWSRLSIASLKHRSALAAYHATEERG